MATGGRKRTGKRKDGGTLKGLRIGSVKELFCEGTQDKVSRTVHDGTARLEALGGELGETTLEALDYALAAYYIVAMAEASSNLSRYDGVRYGGSMENKEEARRSVSANWNEVYAKVRTASFGPEVKRRILLGTFVLSEGYYQAYYVRAQAARTRLRRDFERAFKTFDVLVGPTMPVVAPKIGEKTSPLEDYMMDVNTVPANLVGIPSISIPCGLADGLPVGMQLMAPEFGERLLFEVAEVFAQSMGAGASSTVRGAE
jgi:aspartyl-tRNA(Asn)/glutamyl-tRNA(Gln) amidotransferase subunit A